LTDLSSYKTQEKILSAKAATIFLDQLQEEITPYCEVEMNEMKKFKQNYLLSRNCNPTQLDDRLYFWDQHFMLDQ
jgi:hypothetical protein